MARTLVTITIVAAAVFLLTEALPGDATSGLVERGASPAAVASVRTELGLDKSPSRRLWERLAGLARGDLGRTARGRPVADVLARPLRRTLTLAGIALMAVIVVAVPLGAAMAWRGGRVSDKLLGAASVALISVPEFVVLTLLALLFTSALGLLPAVVVTGSDGRIDAAALVLPALALALPAIAWTARLVRGAVADALELPHVEAARLDGLAPARILLRHALPPALPAIAASIAASCAALAGGSVVVEAAVNYPGVGSVLTQGIQARDVALVSSVVVVMAAVVALAFAIADIVRDLRPLATWA
ncbi:MAG TPA: ABC transporter permease [Solirubrobacteraceae bacterium]|nr:ABC transporter permease [Solirubrobacteraceae bacterium]